MPLTRPLLAWLKSLCSTSLCRTDQALAVFSDWDSTGMRTHPPPPSRSSGAGGVGQGGRPHRPPGAQQGPPSLTVGWGWRGVKPVPKRNPQVRLPTLLPFSLLPCPQRPLPGQYSQEAQETEEEEQGLDSRFPDGYQDRLCQARRPPCGRVDEAASPAGPQPHPPAPRWTVVPGLPGSPHSPDGGPHVPASPHPATCPPSSCRRGHSFACGRGGGPPRAAPGHPLCSETLREMCWEPRAC